jgi:hypothetical protein
MQSQITEENPPSFIGWKYPCGSMRITVEGLGDNVDDETTVLTYTPIAGLESGPSAVVQLEERASIVCSKARTKSSASALMRGRC